MAYLPVNSALHFRSGKASAMLDEGHCSCLHQSPRCESGTEDVDIKGSHNSPGLGATSSYIFYHNFLIIWYNCLQLPALIDNNFYYVILLILKW